MATTNSLSTSPSTMEFASTESESMAMSGASGDALVSPTSTHLTLSDLDGRDPGLFLNTFNLLRRDCTGEFGKEVAGLT